jgi:hypothetical protein
MRVSPTHCSGRLAKRHTAHCMRHTYNRSFPASSHPVCKPKMLVPVPRSRDSLLRPVEVVLIHLHRNSWMHFASMYSTACLCLFVYTFKEEKISTRIMWIETLDIWLDRGPNVFAHGVFGENSADCDPHGHRWTRCKGSPAGSGPLSAACENLEVRKVVS